MQPSKQETKPAAEKTTMKIGDVSYDVDLSKIPYLASFKDFQANAQPEATELTHGPISLFDVALKGIESGYRQCFRSIPAELSQHHILCETYQFLCVDVLSGQSINDIFADLKSGKTDYDFDYGQGIKGDKSKARDSAFRLLYLIILGEFKDQAKDSAKVFNAVLFVVSHSGTFKWRTRTVIRAAYEERFVVSAKQKVVLDKWEKGESAKRATDNDSDVTTEEEESDYYGSDFS
jgi:hypothetical protein